MSPRKAPCAGCRKLVSEDGPFMKCARCKQIYDIFCANIDADMFGKLSVEFRGSWMCTECRCKLPKSDNSHTPVHQHQKQGMHTTNDYLNNTTDISVHSPDNVTMRTGARMAHRQNTEHVNIDDMKNSVIEELKKMQVDFETQLTSKINNLIVEQFLTFKAEFLDKINFLTCKILDLENQYKLSSDKATEHAPTNEKSTIITPENKVPKRKSQPNPRPPAAKAKAKTGGISSGFTLKSNVQEAPLTSVPASSNIDCDETDKESWEEVKRRRSRASLPGVLRGTAAPGSTPLQASERWSYLHLYYVQEGTTTEQVKNHLKSICGSDVCTVDELKPRGRYASFKLGVPSKNAGSVMSSENWAEDICVKPWRQNFRANAKSTQM